MRGNFKPARIRLLSLLLLFLITASGVFAYSAAKSHPAKLAISVETALKAIDQARETHVSFDSVFLANLRQSINLNRNRYYQPQTGRFIYKDPIGFGGGYNLYGYAGNNPITKTDPSGFFPWVIATDETFDGMGYHTVTMAGGALFPTTPRWFRLQDYSSVEKMFEAIFSEVQHYPMKRFILAAHKSRTYSGLRGLSTSCPSKNYFQTSGQAFFAICYLASTGFPQEFANRYMSNGGTAYANDGFVAPWLFRPIDAILGRPAKIKQGLGIGTGLPWQSFNAKE